jgi:glycerol-3-phosphate dehydrogenase
VASTIAGTRIGRTLRLVKGSHLVVPRLWEGKQGYYLQADDGRTMEMFPYEDDFTVIGTTDEAYDGLPQDVAISEAEIDYMLGQANAFLRCMVRRTDVVSTWSGARPLFESRGGRDGALKTLTRDFAFEIDAGGGGAPLLTVFGGKLTTHRRCAAAAMAKLADLGLAPAAGRTRTEALPGGDVGPAGFAAFAARHAWLASGTARRWCRLYGTRAHDLVDGARSADDLGAVLGSDLTEREAEFRRDGMGADGPGHPLASDQGRITPLERGGGAGWTSGADPLQHARAEASGRRAEIIAGAPADNIRLRGRE